MVVSQALKDELLSRNVDEQKILVNPNGVDTEIFNPEILISQRNSLRKKYNLENKFVFGFIGTFSYWHGIELLAKMIPEVVTRQQNVHFMLIGDGVLKKFLVTELHNKNITAVTFTGAIAHNHAKEYLAACDAFLSPTQPNNDGTRFFGSPTKIFEYLSMAKPIIASNLEQLSEIISPAFTESNLSQPLIVNEEVGILLPPTNVGHFVTAACIIANLPPQNIQKLGINARKKALKEYTWNIHVKNIQKFISNKNEKFHIEEENYAQRTSQTRSV